MRSARWRGSAPVVGMFVASTVAAQEHATSEVDWRSRAQEGLQVLYEWEAEDLSTSPQGGGNGYVDHGTLLDRVYSKEGDDFLGVRLITRTNGATTRTELRFFRLLPEGELVDDGPLESFCWEHARDAFPHHDPIGACAELVSGLARERRVEVLDPLFHDVYPDAVPVHETVAVAIPRWFRERFEDPTELQEYVESVSRFEPESLHATLHRSWKSSDDQGLASSSGEVSLLSLRDTSTFEPATGVLLERNLEFSYLHKNNSMIQTRRRAMREVTTHPASFNRPEDASAGLVLREAFRIASTDPREACRRLSEWSRDGLLGYRPLEDVAPQIWLIASRAEREHSRVLGIVRRLGPAAEASLAVADDDTFEALRRGRLSALFTHLGLEGTRHRRAYEASLERRGVDARIVSFLMRMHDEVQPPREPTIPEEPLRSQGSALLETMLRELAGDR